MNKEYPLTPDSFKALKFEKEHQESGTINLSEKELRNASRNFPKPIITEQIGIVSKIRAFIAERLS